MSAEKESTCFSWSFPSALRDNKEEKWIQIPPQPHLSSHPFFSLPWRARACVTVCIHLSIHPHPPRQTQRRRAAAEVASTSPVTFITREENEMPANPIRQQNSETQSNYVLLLPLEVIKQQILSATHTRCAAGRHTLTYTHMHAFVCSLPDITSNHHNDISEQCFHRAGSNKNSHKHQDSSW